MNKYIVTIDPGHGGSDKNNVGPNGYIEANGVLKISKYLKNELEKTGSFKVYLTRDKDTNLSLTQRGKIAAKNNSDLFISQHTNAGPVQAKGVEVFYSVDIPGDRKLASDMSKRIAKVLNTIDRGAKQKESSKYPGEDFYTVIDVAQDNGVPHAILVESGFHSNPTEEAKLKNDNNLRNIAKAQAEAIFDFFGVSIDNIDEPNIDENEETEEENIEKHWAYESLKKVISKNIIEGYEDGKIKPDGFLTRAELSTILDRLGLLD